MKDLYINDSKSEKKRYSGRHKQAESVLAFVIALLVVIIFAALIPMSVSTKASESEAVPGLAFLNLILAVCGMVIAARGMKNHAEHYVLALLGIIINTVMLIVMVSMFFIGL